MPRAIFTVRPMSRKREGTSGSGSLAWTSSRGEKARRQRGCHWVRSVPVASPCVALNSRSRRDAACRGPPIAERLASFPTLKAARFKPKFTVNPLGVAKSVARPPMAQRSWLPPRREIISCRIEPRNPCWIGLSIRKGAEALSEGYPTQIVTRKCFNGEGGIRTPETSFPV